MSTLTMEQRRQDFEAMLAHAERARQAISKFWTTEEDTPGKPIASLARDVAELCSSWATNAKRAQTHRPSDQVKDLAVLVAARCLQALTDTWWTIPEALDYIIEDCALYCWGLNDDNLNHLDLATDPDVRVQNLIVSLGYVAEWWPTKVSTVTNRDALMEQQTSLSHLAFEAVCAALAAERGLWQEEES